MEQNHKIQFGEATENKQTPDNDSSREGKIQKTKKVICEAVDPEYILLFGKIVGGTPHSEIAVYDILVVTNDTPRYDWADIKKYFRMKMFGKNAKVSNINIYIHNIAYIKNNPHPFFYLAHSEGRLLYSREHSIFCKNIIKCDYELAHNSATSYYTISFNAGDKFLEDSKKHIAENNLRQAAYYMSQAMIMFYRTLFAVYHGYDIGCLTLDLLHRRMKTISIDLTILFNPDHTKEGNILTNMDYFQAEVLLNPSFEIFPNELLIYVEKIEKMKNIVQNLCCRRLELYKSRIK